MLPNQLLPSKSTGFQPIGYLLATTKAIQIALVHLWMPDREKKQGMGKADRRGVDNEVTISC